MKHLFTSAFLLLALLLPATASAHDFEVDGIYYDINGNEATVTCDFESHNFGTCYSGEVVIPATVTYNGITYSVTTIGYYAFSECYGLTSVTIPNSVISICDFAFSYCRGLTSVSIGNSVTTIGDGAFSCCSGLSGTLSIPNSVTTINQYAFSGCTGLTGISLGNSVTTIGYKAFCDCVGLTGTLIIPNSVTTIDSYAFSWEDIGAPSELTGLILGNSVTFISSTAFYGCTSMASITVESGNPTFDSRENCNAIIETASNILLIGCKSTIIPNSVTTISDFAFLGCTGLTGITIPNSVTTINDGAFQDCTGLTSITLGNSVTTIGYYAFYGCSGLTGALTIPNSTTSICEGAFYDCSGLTSIDIPNSVITIGNNAFSWCTGLTSITIPNSVTSIGYGVFSGCRGLTSITVESCNPKYDSRENCNAIIETASNTLIAGCITTTIPNSVTSIGNSVFSGCTGLTSIDIPNSVTSIGPWAFNYCRGLTSIDIPNSVTSIGYSAFYGCSGLTDVYSYITDLSEVSIGSDVFYLYPANYSNRTLHVLYGMSTAYRADRNWRLYFGTIVEMDPVPATAIELDKTAAIILEGETLQLTATVLPDYTYNRAVNWYTSNPAVATVDENGLVMAYGLGTATITAVTTDGSNLSASCTATVKSMSAENCFVMDDASVLHGETLTIPVLMNKTESIMAFQTDICLPDGFTLVTNEDNEPMITPSSRLTNDHVIMADQLSDGSVRVICYTPRSKVISGNEGDLFYITVAVPEDAGGDYNLYLRNSLLTTTNYEELNIPNAGAVLTVNTFIPGDVNDSHTVNVTDIVVAAQYILQRNPDPFIFEAADMNGDGNITVTDIMLIARLIMTPPTNAPKHMPAITTNGDRMSSEAISLATGETRTVSLALDNAMDYSAFQLDLNLPDGLTARNFQLTDRAGNHAFDVDAIDNGKVRVLCYSPAIDAIDGNSGALLTFDVTATGLVTGNIMVDGIEFVTTACQPVLFDAFTIGVDNVTAVSEVATGKTVARVDYYNLAGQRIDRPESGVTLVVTTYTDGTRTTTKHLH